MAGHEVKIAGEKLKVSGQKLKVAGHEVKMAGHEVKVSVEYTDMLGESMFSRLGYSGCPGGFFFVKYGYGNLNFRSYYEIFHKHGW